MFSQHQNAPSFGGPRPGTQMFGEQVEESQDPDFTLSIAARQNIENMDLPETRRYSMNSFGSGRAQSIMVTKAEFLNMPVISKCLPEYKPIAL